MSEDAAPVIVIYSRAHAVAALSAAAAANRRMVLASAPNAGIAAGAGWWQALVAAARAAVPEADAEAWLDCGDDAGAAQAAIRAGIEAVVFTGPADIARRLADIAGQSGIWLVTERPEGALDLGADFFSSEERLRQRCADILASPPTFC